MQLINNAMKSAPLLINKSTSESDPFMSPAQFDVHRNHKPSTSNSQPQQQPPRNPAPGTLLGRKGYIVDSNCGEIDRGKRILPAGGVRFVDLVEEEDGATSSSSSKRKKKNSRFEERCVLNTVPKYDDEVEFGLLPMKYPVYPNDISRGEEKVKVPLVNEFGAPLNLPNILYIATNMVHKDAHVDFSLARLSDDDCCAGCSGDCLAAAALPCGCAAETGGEFAYSPDGLLKAEFLDRCVAMNKVPERKHYYYCDKVCPLTNDLSHKGKRVKACKGHLSRKFIKECWSKCGCSKRCGNRVVQKGVRVPLQVFASSEEKGWGVRSVTALQKGTFICEYIGEIVTNLELYERNKERAAKNEVHTYPVLLDADWGSERILKDEEALCLDATEFGNVGRFINHRCGDANLIEIPVEVESPDHHYYHVAFFTVRDVEAMEELTWDYGIEFDDIYHPIKAFKCRCGSKQCRDKTKASR